MLQLFLEFLSGVVGIQESVRTPWRRIYATNIPGMLRLCAIECE